LSRGFEKIIYYLIIWLYGCKKVVS
jgi:hypothetical protein